MSGPPLKCWYGPRRIQFRTTSFVKERPFDDHCCCAVGEDVCLARSGRAFVRSGCGFKDFGELPLAGRKTARDARHCAGARPRGFQRFELHARNCGKSMGERISCGTAESTKLRRDGKADANAL